LYLGGQKKGQGRVFVEGAKKGGGAAGLGRFGKGLRRDHETFRFGKGFVRSWATKKGRGRGGRKKS